MLFDRNSNEEVGRLRFELETPLPRWIQIWLRRRAHCDTIP